MKIIEILKNRHAGQLGWNLSNSGGIFFSGKPGKINISIQWDLPSRWDVLTFTVLSFLVSLFGNV